MCQRSRSHSASHFPDLRTSQKLANGSPRKRSGHTHIRRQQEATFLASVFITSRLISQLKITEL